MTIASTLNIPVSDSDYVCDHWGIDHCDPKAWSYKPGTYGVDGVELIGDKEMKLFSEFTGFWKNPTRAEFSLSDCQALADRIETDGIDTTCQVIYWDIDDDSRVNGGHRQEAGSILKIPGWMCQAVRFRDEEAKIEFANRSNILKQVHHKNPTSKDVESTVRSVLNIMGEYDLELIKEKVKFHGSHLTYKQRTKIIDDLYIELRVNGGVKSGSKYQEFNDERLKKLFVEIADNDPWLSSYWENDDEICIYLNVANITSRVGALLSANVSALSQDKPLHIIYTVPLPNRKESLQTKREKFWSSHMKRIEDTLLQTFGLGEAHRSFFRWNHADCEHRTVAQDVEVEDPKKLVNVTNRTYN